MQHACDVPDLEYRFYREPVIQANGAMLYGAARCNQCPRRWHLLQMPNWQNPYWFMTPSGPMPGAVGPAGYDTGRIYTPTQEELDHVEQERERRRIIRAEADLVARRRSDEWKEWLWLRQHIHPKQFRVKVRRR